MSVGWSALIVFIGFLGDSIGCVLAVFCLVRMTEQTRSSGSRLRLALLTGVVLVECAYDGALFAAAGVQAGGVALRFSLWPGLAVVAVAMIVSCAGLAAVARRPTRMRAIRGAVLTGLAVAVASLEAITSVRGDRGVGLDRPDTYIIVIAVGVVTVISVMLAFGANLRPQTATAIMLLATSLTAAQYLLTREVLVDAQALSVGSGGLGPIGIIGISGSALVVRTVVLTVLSFGDASGPAGRERAASTPATG